MGVVSVMTSALGVARVAAAVAQPCARKFCAAIARLPAAFLSRLSPWLLREAELFFCTTSALILAVCGASVLPPPVQTDGLSSASRSAGLPRGLRPASGRVGPCTRIPVAVGGRHKGTVGRVSKIKGPARGGSESVVCTGGGTARRRIAFVPSLRANARCAEAFACHPRPTTRQL